MLHITNGDSVVSTLREAGVPGECSAWADVLWEGPVQDTGDDYAFLKARARFLSESGYGPSFEEVYTQSLAWQQALENYGSHDEVVLWFEHDLFDQLILIRLLDWFRRQELGSTNVSLICIGAYPGMRRFRGLGELRAYQLAPLLETRQRVTEPKLQLGSAAWKAFSGPDPTAVEKLIAEDRVTALPFLAGALHRLLEEFPSLRNNLSRSEEQTVKAAGALRMATAEQLFFAVQDMEERPFMGDTSFWRILKQLSQHPGALVRIHEEPDSPISSHKVEVTEEGRRVLEGGERCPKMLTTDKWIGGVHVYGGEGQWRWNGVRLVRSAGNKEL